MGEKIGYSMGDGSANLIFQMMMMFQLFFYTDVFGIRATTAGMIFLVARIFDAFVDPAVGSVERDYFMSNKYMCLLDFNQN